MTVLAVFVAVACCNMLPQSNATGLVLCHLIDGLQILFRFWFSWLFCIRPVFGNIAIENFVSVTKAFSYVRKSVQVFTCCFVSCARLFCIYRVIQKEFNTFRNLLLSN